MAQPKEDPTYRAFKRRWQLTKQRVMRRLGTHTSTEAVEMFRFRSVSLLHATLCDGCELCRRIDP